MEWKTVKLGDILNFRRGHDLPHSEMREGDIPVAGSNGCIGYHNVATPITPIITIGRSGNIGTPYYYEKAWAHNTTLYLDDFKGNNPKYLYYLLKTLPLAAFTGGSAVPTLNRNHIHPLEVLHVDDRATQDKIVAILSSLDDKIENNNRINRNLEEQAQALFKSWFVDFEPWGGTMPEDWKEGTLESITDKIASGGTPKSMNKQFYIGNIKWFSTKELTDSFLIDSEKHISEDAYKNSAAKMFPAGTVLMAIYAAPTVGRLGILLNEATFNQAAVGMIAKTEIGKEYLYLLLKSERTKLNNLASGAAQQNLNVGIVKNYPIIIPHRSVSMDFQNMVKPLFDQIANNQKESQRLATLRDTLLPKLMRGEISL